MVAKVIRLFYSSVQTNTYLRSINRKSTKLCTNKRFCARFQSEFVRNRGLICRELRFYLSEIEVLLIWKQRFNPLIFKRTRFALQKDSFWCAKGVLLECKRTPFGRQKDYIWKPWWILSENHLIILVFQLFLIGVLAIFELQTEGKTMK